MGGQDASWPCTAALRPLGNSLHDTDERGTLHYASNYLQSRPHSALACCSASDSTLIMQIGTRDSLASTRYGTKIDPDVLFISTADRKIRVSIVRGTLPVLIEGQEERV